MRLRRLLLFVIVLAAAVPFVRGDDKKKKEPKERPRVIVALPFGVPPGATTKVTLRGLKLDSATEVRCHDPKGRAKLLNKGSAGVPRPEDAGRMGNTQVEIELTLPAEAAGDAVTVSVVTPDGESLPHRILIDRTPLVAEKEPNNGFDQATPLALGQTASGVIGGAFDVDVYRFEGKAGQKIVAEVFAARLGSTLDSFLTLYDAKRNTLAANDDWNSTTRDSRIEATLPADGVYFLVLVDANDTGDATHVYRLNLAAR